MTNLERAKSKKLTLRDELALSALKAVNSDDNYMSIEDAAKALGIDPSEYDYKAHWPTLAANQCYAFADAFLNAREVISTNIFDETEEPELWRDLKEGEVIKEGDRVLIKSKWEPAKELIGTTTLEVEVKPQRRVRKEDL